MTASGCTRRSPTPEPSRADPTARAQGASKTSHGNEHRRRRFDFRTLSSWDGTPYTSIVRLPELTGEIDPVSVDSRDIDAEIGVFITPK